jgi:preprotein translocase subunit SecG
VSALITIIHVIICLILIVAVLLQSGKAADLAGAFGGGGSQTAFGPRGAATILSKLTTISAVLFMITSMGLWILSAKGTKSVVSGQEPPAQTVPAATETKKEQDVTPAQKPEEKQAPAQQQQAPPAETQKTAPQKKDSTPDKKVN